MINQVQFRRVLTVLLGLVSPMALAFNAQNLNCRSSESDVHADFRAMIRQISVDDHDDRDGFSAVRPQMVISDEEADSYNRAVGQCVCPVVEKGKRRRGFVRTAACSLLKFDDRITTNAHQFVDKTTGQPFPLIDECYFETLSAPYIRKNLAFDRGFAVGTYDVRGESNMDFAVVMLESPALGIKPITIDESFHRVVKDEVIYAWSAPQPDMAKQVVGEPIAQICKVLGHFRTVKGNASNFGTSCDGSKGASAGIVATHLNGRVVAVGMTVEGARSEFNGKAATSLNGRGIRHMYFSQPFLEALSDPKAFAGGKQANSQPVGNNRPSTALLRSGSDQGENL